MVHYVCVILLIVLIWFYSRALVASGYYLSVSVSGMDFESLLVGRPFGGCSILYRN